MTAKTPVSHDPLSISRRDAISIFAGAALSGGSAAAESGDSPVKTSLRETKSFRVRTLTAGTTLSSFADLHLVEAALDFLTAAKQRFEALGFEVQTVRVTLNPLLLGASSAARSDALGQLIALDRLAVARHALISIGPVFSAGDSDQNIGTWAAHLARETRALSFSGSVASQTHGVHREAVIMAARVIAALTNAVEGGLANFRFGAAACVPAGTPFFPVGFHEGSNSLAVGLETPRLVQQAFAAGGDPSLASERLRALLDAKLQPVERIARGLAEQGQRRYLGIDTSPAPGKDSSIGLALETLTGQPFGAASTLQACAAVTTAIKSVSVATCGYSGLMLPILEDPVLAQRVIEGRIKISDLLLYSTVCGTGLDLVPVPGNAAPEDLTRVIGDVATLAARLKKPLSARLFPVPGKNAGDHIDFTDPLLCASKVMPLDP
jgi:uncharacterized protein